MLRKRFGKGIIAILLTMAFVFGSSATFMMVSAQNSPPDILSVPDDIAWAEKLYEYQVLAVDYDGDPLVYQIWASPDGMTIDNATGLISWTPTLDMVGETVIVGIVVEDPSNGKAMQNYTLEVLEPPRPEVDILNPYNEQVVSGIINIQGFIYRGWWGDGSEPVMNTTFQYNLSIMDANGIQVWSYTGMVIQDADYIKETSFSVELDTRTLEDGVYHLIANVFEVGGLDGNSEVIFSIDNDHSGDVVWFVYPQENAMVDGMVQMIGGANSAKKIDKVEIRIDYAWENAILLDWTPAQGTYDWTFDYEFSNKENTCYVIFAQAISEGQVVGQDKIDVCTDNIAWPPPPPPPPPQGNIKIWIESPSYDDTVKGVVTISFGARGGDNATFYKGTVYISDEMGKELDMTFEQDTVPGNEVTITLDWDTTEMPNGNAYIEIEMMDDLDNWGFADVEVFINNDGTDPPPPPPPPPKEKLSVDILSPLDGETVKDRVTVTGRVFYSENVRTLTVVILLDDKDLTKVLVSGGKWQDWSFELDTTVLKKGKHTLMAKVTTSLATSTDKVNIVVDQTGVAPPPIIPDGTVNSDGSISVEGKGVDFKSPTYPGLDPEGLNYTWDFGDGTISHEKDPTHNYDANGDYKVKLEVTDGKISKEETVDLSVNDRAYKTSVPGFGAPVLILGLTLGALVAFFRSRK